MAHITIPAGEPLVSYTPGGSSTGPFNVTFPIFAESDLNVVVNGVLLSSSDWTFTPTDTRTGGHQAGYITLDSATTYEVVIYRDATRSRTSDYASGPLDINTLNTDVDRTVARDQDLKLQIDRTLRSPASEPAMDALPDAATRANQYLIFDADGQPTLAAYGVTTTPVSSFMATVLDDTTAADARTTLGVTLENLGYAIASDAEFLARAATNRILTPGNLAARPHFRAKKSADQTSIADATVTKCTFTTEVVDNGSYYDAANSKWTPPSGPVVIMLGIYQLGTMLAGATVYASIYKNGAQYRLSAPARAASTSAAVNIAVLFDVANGTDYYEAYGYIDTSAGTGTFSNNEATYFEGIWLG